MIRVHPAIAWQVTWKLDFDEVTCPVAVCRLGRHGLVYTWRRLLKYLLVPVDWCNAKVILVSIALILCLHV